MNNKSKSKYLIFIICALLSLVITYFSSEIILSKLNIHKFNNESASIKIEMLDQSNKQSYGREMRIVSLTINGAKLNLADYANDKLHKNEIVEMVKICNEVPFYMVLRPETGYTTKEQMKLIITKL